MARGRNGRGVPRGREDELIEFLAECRHDPLKFVRFIFPWGMPGTELEDFDGPDQWQLELLEDIRDGLLTANQAIQLAVASGHGVGKSSAVAWIILWAMSTKVDTKGIVTANTEVQLKTKTWAELAKWHRLAACSHWFTLTATAIYSTDPLHEKTWRIDQIAWSEARPEAFAGLHNKGRRVLLVFDEASAIADIIWEVAEGALTDEGTEIIWCAFGNPTRDRGRFKDCFGRFKRRWKTRQIDSRTARMTNKKQLQAWIEDYGIDSDFVKVRVLGQFPVTGTNALFNEDMIDKAMARCYKPGQFEHGEKVTGVDVARQGMDDSVIAQRWGLVAFPIQRMHIPDTQLVANQVANAQDRFGGMPKQNDDATLIDATGGYGVGVVDALRAMGRSCIEVYFSGKAADPRYFNKRAEMYFLLAVWLKKGGQLPKDDDLRKELLAITYSFSGDKFKISEKEEIRAELGFSPDAADALACTFAFPIAPGSGDRQISTKTVPSTAPSYAEPVAAGASSQSYDPYDIRRL